MTEVLTEQTPPILQGPSDKEKKYDRQLRLWAANGQQALEDAHILLLNSGSGAVGVETLKNLVLPGIGRFTIADDAIVNEADLGVNFFLDQDCLGKSRSESCANFLKELNPDVNGGHTTTSELEVLFKNDTPFTLILYTFPIAPKILALVEEYSQHRQTPLISIISAGFYSYFRLQLPGNFPIVDTHPDSTATTDLRLLSPWQELTAFAREQTAEIDTLDAHEHGHIPYLVLLLHYLEEWKLSHSGTPPKTYSEKNEFKKLVTAAARTDNAEGGEENYDEAVAAVMKNISASTLPSSVREVFEYKPDMAEAESNFWVITDAIKKFHSKHNALPLPGSVPDMKAQSKVYVQLQNLYKSKARHDVAEVLASVQEHPHGATVTQEEVESYCKNAAFIKLIPVVESSVESLKKLADAELNAEFTLQPTLIPIYLALQASQQNPEMSESDILASMSTIVPNAADDERLQQAAQEVSRAKGGELHNISSLTGGMVSQEIIKIITKQYVPIENTVVFDGITSRSQILRI